MKIHIAGGRLIDPRSGVDTRKDLFIAAGRIIAIGDAPKGFSANRTIDAAGLVVCPGLVDLAARLREPGFEYMATLESELYAAVASGVTSLACPPDTDPPLDEPGLVEMLKFRARNLNQAHVYPIGALTQALKGVQLTEMAELVDAGCVAFSQSDAPMTDNHVLFCGLQYAATFGFCVWLRPQDATLARNGVAHDGQVATRLGLPAIPACAETVALSTILLLTRATGAKVHLCRLSTAEGIEMVRQAKRAGIPVTCDVAIHHVHLSEMDIGYFDPNCYLMPPLRCIASRPRRWHRGCDLLRPHSGRRRCQAIAVCGGRGRRHSLGTSAAIDAEVGGRTRYSSGNRAWQDHLGCGPRHGHRRGSSVSQRNCGHLHIRSGSLLESRAGRP